jgi:4-amino-4-deoxy-L-arabinose transferase-like glycosyltransferase
MTLRTAPRRLKCGRAEPENEGPRPGPGLTLPRGRRELLSVAAITAIGLAARLAHLHSTTGGHWGRLTFPDETSYYLAGARLIREQGLEFFSTDRSLWNGPLVPLWVLLFSMRVAAVKVVNLLLLACAGLLVWDAARARAGRTAGLVALLLCTAHPPFSVFGPTILSEPPFVFLVTLSFWVAHRSLGRREWMAVAGIVVGLAALTRPTIQLWPLFALALSVALGVLAPALRAHRRATAALLAGFCLVVVPIVARNALVLRRPAIANGFGAVLYLGNDLRRDGDEPSYSGFDFDTYEWTSPFTHLDSEGDRQLVRRALQSILAHPADVALLTARKAVRYLLGEPVSYLAPYRDIASAVRASRSAAGWALLEMVTTLTALLLGLAGIARRWRELPAFLAASFVVYMTALHALAFPIPRLALPLFPVLAVYAGCAAADLARGRGAGSRVCEKVAAACVPVAVAGMCLWNLGRPALLVPPRYSTFFDQNTRVDLTGWTSLGLTNNGRGWAQAISPSPCIAGPVGPVIAAANQAILVRLSMRAPRRLSTVRIHWSTGGPFDVSRSAAFDVLADGSPHDYRVVPSPTAGWSGSIRAFRLEFVDISTSSRVQVEDIRVVR